MSKEEDLYRKADEEYRRSARWWTVAAVLFFISFLCHVASFIGKLVGE